MRRQALYTLGAWLDCSNHGGRQCWHRGPHPSTARKATQEGRVKAMDFLVLGLRECWWHLLWAPVFLGSPPHGGGASANRGPLALTTFSGMTFRYHQHLIFCLPADWYQDSVSLNANSSWVPLEAGKIRGAEICEANSTRQQQRWICRESMY